MVMGDNINSDARMEQSGEDPPFIVPTIDEFGGYASRIRIPDMMSARLTDPSSVNMNKSSSPEKN